MYDHGTAMADLNDYHWWQRAPVPLHDDVVSYRRTFQDSGFLVDLNFSDRPLELVLPQVDSHRNLYVSTAGTTPVSAGDRMLPLRTWEGQILGDDPTRV